MGRPPHVVFQGNQTVSGNGNVFIGSFTGWTAQNVLTIAPGILIRGGGNISYYNGSLVNQGTIRAEPDTKPFTFTASATTSNKLTNQGRLRHATRTDAKWSDHRGGFRRQHRRR